MTIIELFLIATSLAIDAFVVSLWYGLEMKSIIFRKIFFIAFLFGLFQAIMPYLGFSLGKSIEPIIKGFQGWLMPSMLCFLGFKMLKLFYETRHSEQEKSLFPSKTNFHKKFFCWSMQELKVLFILSIATSIDAFAIGLSFISLPQQINIYFSVTAIGVITFIYCFCGVFIGHTFGTKLGSKAELIGGSILVLLGIKMFLT